MSTVDRPLLSRDRIAATALEIIDAQGLAGLSMRKLGAELGVEAMSLYHYVTNKSDLLDAVIDRLYGEIALPVVDDDAWEDAIRLGLRSFHRVLVDHPAAVELFTSGGVNSARRVEVLHWAHQRFQAVGLSVSDAHHALHFAVSFVMGHASNEGSSEPSRPDPSAEILAASGIDDPEAVRFFAELDDNDPDQLFEAGLDLVVHGLRARFDLP